MELLRSQLSTSELLTTNSKSDFQSAQHRITELEEQIRLLSTSETREVTDNSGQLKAEIARLSAQNRDCHRVEQQCKDLEVLRKSLETEVTRLTFVLESTRSQLTETRDRLHDQEKKFREIELNLHKKELDYEALKVENARFAFQRESLEAEISTLKQTLTSYEAKLDKKRKKQVKIAQQSLENRTELQNSKLTLEIRLKDTENQLEQAKFDLRQKIREIEAISDEKIAKIEKELQEKRNEIQTISIQLRENEEKLRESEEKCAKLSNISAESQVKSISLEEQLNKQGKEIGKLQIMLESAQKKRELARTEVIKLTQKLEQKHVDSESSPVAQSEVPVLMALRRDLELTYKALVTLMMTGEQVSVPEATKRALLVDADAFSGIERRLNDLVMQAHEAMEAPEPPDHPVTSTSWSGRLTSAVKQSVKGPVKLFSCISAPSDQLNPTITMKPRTAQGQRLMSGTGGHTAPVVKRKNSADPGSN